jgi:NAD(P)-dependent dehydrogenase (short-subunit alcohol dehydrogenase family)
MRRSRETHASHVQSVHLSDRIASAGHRAGRYDAVDFHEIICRKHDVRSAHILLWVLPRFRAGYRYDEHPPFRLPVSSWIISEFSFAVSASIAASSNKAGSNGRVLAMAFSPAVATVTISHANRRPPARVRVNAIAPSATMTERVKKLVAGNAALTRLADSHLVGLIEPDDIASTALYLASDESRMVTGQVLPVDSGVTIS